ncbi:MAG: anaerobic ribonucleoside-triphosphate reductase activating protein [Candidatus Gastranaerophilales bacterium]|nr:anaerobic ribonucleoside-triphosphate reductase activating protein [Candidatus Gastranaerophilales bacterium]
MNYHNITKDDMLNGDGLRVVLWVSGCTHCCDGCQNPETWEVSSGIEFDASAKEELFEALEPDYISGITFSGGDPLHPFNRAEVLGIAKELKEKMPSKTVWLYTGFLWEEIKDAIDLSSIDVLVDGEFKQELNDNNLKWIGSSNQRIIDVQATLKEDSIVLHCKN